MRPFSQMEKGLSTKGTALAVPKKLPDEGFSP
jgi:hypothetical protein